MFEIRNKLLATTALVALVSMPIQPAFSQDDGSNDEFDEPIEEIFVPGVRIGRGLSQATFEVGVEEIEARPLGAEITQSLQQIPGVQVSTGDSRGGVFSYEIYLRGLTDEQIGFSIDGVPTGDSRTQGGGPANRFLDSSNVQRIVVSQSSGEIGSPTRFGLGGFMNFVTLDPSDESEYTLEASTGSFNHRRVFARAHLGDIFGGIRGYASYSDQETDVWTGGDRMNSRQHATLKLVKDFDQGHSIALNVNWNDLVYNDFNIITQPSFLANPRSDGAVGNFRGIPSLDQINSLQPYGPAMGGFREDLFVYANLDFQLTDNFILEINPYYHKGEGESNSLQDRARTIAGGDPRGLTGYDPMNGSAIRPAVTQTPSALRGNFGEPFDLRISPRDRDRHGVTAELRYEWDDGFLTALRGGFWIESSKGNEDRNFYPLSDPASSIQINRNNLSYVAYERDAEVATKMFYGQASFSFFDDRVNLDAGLTWMRNNYEAMSPLEYQGIVDFDKDSDILPKVGVTIDLTDNLELFGAYAQNWAGIPEDTFLGTTGAAITPDLRGLESENLDIGLRYVGNDSAFSVQAYRIDLEGLIANTPLDPLALPTAILLGNATLKAENIGDQRTNGVEVTGYHDFGSVDIYASYAYQDAKHSDEGDPVVAQSLRQAGVIAGEAVRDIPEHSFFAKIGWDQSDNLRFEASVNYIGERVGGHLVVPNFCNAFFCFDGSGMGVNADDPLGLDMLEAYTTIGFLAQYEIDFLEGVTLQLNIDNLLDEEYISAVSGATANLAEFGAAGNFGGGDVTAQSGSLDRYFIGAPRTVTFSVKVDF